MTLYYSLVFALLVFEMVVFMTLILPLPFTVKRGLFTFIFILILFIDSVNRVYRVQVELAQAKYQGGSAAAVAGSERMEVQARKFYSQRNMYLCGFTLFLSLILNRTYTMILETLRLEQEVKTLRGEKPANDKNGAKLGEAGEMGEISQLKKEIRQKDKQLEAMKKQSQGLSDEYNRLGDQVAGAGDGVPKKDR